jgi:hypothetical protein
VTSLHTIGKSQQSNQWPGSIVPQPDLLWSHRLSCLVVELLVTEQLCSQLFNSLFEGDGWVKYKVLQQERIYHLISLLQVFCDSSCEDWPMFFSDAFIEAWEKMVSFINPGVPEIPSDGKCLSYPGVLEDAGSFYI